MLLDVFGFEICQCRALFVEGLKLCLSEFGGNDRIWASHPWSRIGVLHGKVMFQ